MPRFILHPSTFILLLCPLFSLAAPKDDAPANADSKFSLTVYSTADASTFDPQDIADNRQANPAYKIPGYGVVREVRKITLNAGENLLKFSDVAAGIDPTTVSFKSLTAPDSTAVLEQNYEYDLVSPDKLLEKYLGKNIIINRKQEPLPTDHTRMPESIEAKLLSFTNDQLVLQTNNKQLPVQVIPRNLDITEIKLFDLQTGLITKPTLVWKLTAEKPGEHNVLVSYQTANITWRADYIVAVNKGETAADLSSWVTLVNESGASYPNARLRLVAGDVHRLNRPAETMLFGGGDRAGTEPAFKEKSFFEYHLYTLSRPTNIANNATKQIELFTARNNLPVTKTYVYAGQPEQLYPYGNQPYGERDIHDPSNKKVDVYLQLKNTEKNGLGIPLPAGRVRVYKRDLPGGQTDADDPAGTLEFIGEDKIDHTPKDEEVLVRLGSAFDVVGQRKQTDFTIDGHTMTETFEIKLRNHKKQAVTVLVKETLFRWSQWQITAASDKFEKHDSRTIYIPVEVPADQEKTITYTVKYTW